MKNMVHNVKFNTWWEITRMLIPEYSDDRDLTPDEILKVERYLTNTYGLTTYSREVNHFHYRVVDPSKYTLFLLKWGDSEFKNEN